MASNAKRRTTMAKLNREQKMREKRMEKAARKDARKREAALGHPTEVELPEQDPPQEA